MAKCISDLSCNKVSHRLKIETIKMRVSFATMPIYFDNVTDDKFLARISEGFADGEVYETIEVCNQKHLYYQRCISTIFNLRGSLLEGQS